MGVQAVLSYANSVLTGGTSARVVADPGNRVYDHPQALPLREHQDRKRGEILALLTNDVWRIGSFLSGTVMPFLPLILTCIGALVLQIHVDPRHGDQASRTRDLRGNVCPPTGLQAPW